MFHSKYYVFFLFNKKIKKATQKWKSLVKSPQNLKQFSLPMTKHGSYVRYVVFLNNFVKLCKDL